MCLGPEFFDAREALVRQREAEGDFELGAFLEPRKVSLDLLYASGLLNLVLNAQPGMTIPSREQPQNVAPGF